MVCTSSHITTLLDSGTTIICDRYAFSGIAFSASKTSSRGPLLSYEWCRAPDISLPAPDLTLFLDISPEKAAKERKGYGEERYEKLEMQVRVREIFGRIGEEMGGDKWIKVDADGSREDVAQAVWKAVEHLRDGTEKPIGKLWEGIL
jgi:dTMP kinase